jgi:hypothetical protein
MHNWYHSSISGIPYIHGHKLQCTTIHGAFPLLLSSLASSPLSPFVPLSTYLEPSYSRRKKTWPVREKKNFLRQKSYSNVTIILCISLIMIFNCFPIIFWLFRQVHEHRFFFSLLTVFAMHTDNPEIHKCRSFFAKANILFKVDFNIFNW